MDQSVQMTMNYENYCLGLGQYAKKKVPFLLVTGFLGSGKTTLLRHVLQNKSNLRVAVLVNELGKIDIDSQLIGSTSTNSTYGIATQELANGCMCCSTSSNTKDALSAILERGDMLDYVLVETSGAADPRPVACLLSELGRLDLVTVVIDASAIEQHFETGIALEQLRAADLLVLNKCDLVAEDALEALEKTLVSKAGKGIKIVRSTYSNVPLSAIMDVSVEHATQTGDGFLSHEAVDRAPKLTVGANPHFHNKKNHAGSSDHSAHQHSKDALTTFCFESARPLLLSRFQHVIARELLPLQNVFRAKGLLWFAERPVNKLKYEFHVSGRQHADVEERGEWFSEKKVQFVVIGRDLDHDALERHLRGCVCEAPSTDLKTGCEDATSLAQKLAGDGRFVVYDDDSSGGDGSCGDGSCVLQLGLRGDHINGIYESDLNTTLQQEVNKSGVVFVTAVKRPSCGTRVLLVSFCGGRSATAPPDAVLQAFLDAGSWTIEKHFQGVNQCKCGF